MLCSIVKHLEAVRALKKWGETLDYVSCFSLHFFRALTASCVLYNRTEHNKASLFFKYIALKEKQVRIFIAIKGSVTANCSCVRLHALNTSIQSEVQ